MKRTDGLVLLRRARTGLGSFPTAVSSRPVPADVADGVELGTTTPCLSVVGAERHGRVGDEGPWPLQTPRSDAVGMVTTDTLGTTVRAGDLLQQSRRRHRLAR